MAEMRIEWHGPQPDYGPAYEPTLEDAIAALQRLMAGSIEDRNPEGGNELLNASDVPIDPRMMEAIKAAFENPIPTRTGNPMNIGPYQVGYTVPHPDYEKGGKFYDPSSPGYQGDDSYIDAIEYSAKQGMLPKASAEYLKDNLLNSDEDDYMGLVQTGELSLADAIRMMGRVPQQISKLPMR